MELSNQGLTVIVPALNEEHLIGRVLDRIVCVSGLDGVEVIVVDGGSTDDTVPIARQRARVVRGPRGRAAQMNYGSRLARGRVLVYCHADTLLPAGYGRAIERALSNPNVIGGSFTPRYRPANRVLRVVERFLALPTNRLVFGDQAIFARRSALEAIGFYAPIAIMEDVALVRSLGQMGDFIRLPENVLTSSRRLIERGVIRQLWLDLTLLTAFYLGCPPQILADRYWNTSRDRPL